MNPQTTTALSLRLFGLYCIVESAPLLQAALVGPVIQSSDTNVSLPLIVVTTSVPFALLFGLGIFLFFRSSRLAAAWFPEARDAISNQNNELHAIALSVVGAFVFVSAIPDIAQIASNFILISASFDSESHTRSQQMMNDSGTYVRRNWAFLISSFFRLFLGMAFFLKSRLIVNFWNAQQDRRAPGSNT